jgi:hypothetical protein
MKRNNEYITALACLKHADEYKIKTNDKVLIENKNNSSLEAIVKEVQIGSRCCDCAKGWIFLLLDKLYDKDIIQNYSKLKVVEGGNE